MSRGVRVYEVRTSIAAAFQDVDDAVSDVVVLRRENVRLRQDKAHALACAEAERSESPRAHRENQTLAAEFEEETNMMSTDLAAFAENSCCTAHRSSSADGEGSPASAPSAEDAPRRDLPAAGAGHPNLTSEDLHCAAYAARGYSAACHTDFGIDFWKKLADKLVDAARTQTCGEKSPDVQSG